jgi:cytochrome c-type biogenesis protein CcmE
MNHVRWKLLIAGSVILAGVIILAVGGIRDGWVYFLPVDEFLSEPDRQGQRVRLHGVVASEALEVNRTLLLARFELTGETHRLPVEYEGVIPDQFMADREVVVEGALDETGIFQADTLLTKCASKYDSAEGEAPHADPRLGAEDGS